MSYLAIAALFIGAMLLGALVSGFRKASKARTDAIVRKAVDEAEAKVKAEAKAKRTEVQQAPAPVEAGDVVPPKVERLQRSQRRTASEAAPKPTVRSGQTELQWPTIEWN